MSKTQSRWISFSGHTLAVAALMTTGGFLLHAQTPGANGASVTQTVSAQEPAFPLQLMVDEGQADPSGEGYSSSLSSSGLRDADGQNSHMALNTGNPFHFFNAQYGGGR